MIKIEKKPQKSKQTIPQISDLIQKYGMNFHDAQHFMSNLAKKTQKST